MVGFLFSGGREPILSHIQMSIQRAGLCLQHPQIVLSVDLGILNTIFYRVKHLELFVCMQRSFPSDVGLLRRDKGVVDSTLSKYFTIFLLWDLLGQEPFLVWVNGATCPHKGVYLHVHLFLVRSVDEIIFVAFRSRGWESLCLVEGRQRSSLTALIKMFDRHSLTMRNTPKDTFLIGTCLVNRVFLRAEKAPRMSLHRHGCLYGVKKQMTTYLRRLSRQRLNVSYCLQILFFHPNLFLHKVRLRNQIRGVIRI